MKNLRTSSLPETANYVKSLRGQKHYICSVESLWYIVTEDGRVFKESKKTAA